MDYPEDRLYSEYHLWVKLEDRRAAVGITEYAKEELGDVDYIELPEPDSDLSKDTAFGFIETSKAVTDLIAPLSGVVIEVNDLITDSPDGLSEDPYGDGWLVIVEPADKDELNDLMEAGAYRNLIENMNNQ